MEDWTDNAKYEVGDVIIHNVPDRTWRNRFLKFFFGQEIPMKEERCVITHTSGAKP